ncbi:HET domain-containing protein [Fusarium keratoplasticum]|uniref:HET domain-containing protein n=1 Tax=Fusarium keratoplasticum TaxID=1328300 RepID=A0ACC0RB12_9HYPO|nr:HET domain-containing protein [Fusarium keratoplasticum]KAI8680334.1 HET domain-containing protein [Fusarium keratoplasticum]
MSDPSQDPGSKAAQLYDSLPIPRDAQFIRVLDIPAKSSTANESLTGSLRIVNLKDSPKFTALSYVWGKASGKSINCNGYEVKVTDSCFEALSSLREAIGSFTIWVDAICINQMDDDEKAAQIPLMGEIYIWAEVAYIWLGPSTVKIKKALDYVKFVSQYRLFPAGIPWNSGNRLMTASQEQTQLYKTIRSMTFFKGFSNEDRWLPAKLPPLPQVNVDRVWVDFTLRVIWYFMGPLYPYRFNYDWDSLLELVDQAWLRRSWTFQESALASNPILVFGQEHVSWQEWQQAIAWINDLMSLKDTSRFRPLRGTRAETACLWPVQKWMSLCNIWQVLPRPCCWNGDRFREVLDKAGGFKEDCSVREYWQKLDMYRIQHQARSSANNLHWVIFLFLGFLAKMIEVWSNNTQWRSGVFYILWDACVWLVKLGVMGCIGIWLIPTYLPKIQPSWHKFTCISQPKNSEQRDHLVGLIRAMRERECSLKEDRVFAAGAIFKRLGIHQPTPDYRKLTGEIYRDSLTGLIEWDSSFISLLIDSGSHLPDAPSWVPDWSTVAQRSWLSSSYIYDAIQAPQQPGEAAPISISGNTLSVHAAFLHTVTHCTVPFRSAEVDSAGNMIPGMEENFLHNAQVLFRWVMRVRGDVLVDGVYESIPLGVLSALNGYRTDLTSMDTDAQHAFNKVYTTMKRHSGKLKNQLETMAGIVPATRATLKDMADEQACLAFIFHACNNLAGKRGLFLCSNGTLGSGPETMLEGDLIALVKGVAVPMVLRRQSDSAQADAYTVVGPSFVDGLMNLGVEELEKMNLDWQQIDLV